MPLQGWDRRIGFGVRKGESPDTLLTRRTEALDSEAYGTRKETRERRKKLGVSSTHFRKTGKQLMGPVRKCQKSTCSSRKRKNHLLGVFVKSSLFTTSLMSRCAVKREKLC